MYQPKEFSVFVNGDGDLEYLYTDQFAGDEFGALQISRASEVEYDDGLELRPVYDRDSGEIMTWEPTPVRPAAWVATLNDGREIARHKLRDEVLRLEREVIERMLAAGEPIPERQDLATVAA